MRWLPLALVLIALALPLGNSPGAAQQRLGPGNPSCYEIRNLAPYTILTHVILPSRVRSVARIKSNETQRHCLQGELFPEGRVNFRVVSGLGPPLFSCMTQIDKTLVISARQDASGGWEYDANCH